MPTVPVEQNHVGFAETTNAKLQPADFSGTGLEALGRGLQQVGQAGQQYAEARQAFEDRVDDAAIKHADAEDTAKIAAVRDNFTKLQKTQADKDAFDTATAQIAEIKKTRMASLTNPVQRAMYSDAFDLRAPDTLQVIAQHYGQEVAAAETEAAGSRYLTKLDTAVDLQPTNPGGAEAALLDAFHEIRAANPGAMEEDYLLKGLETLSSFHTRVADRIRAEDPLAAERYINDHAGEILPAEENEFRRINRPAFEEAQDDAMWEEVLIGPPAADADMLQQQTAAANRDATRGAGMRTAGFTPGPDGATGQDGEYWVAPAGTPVYPPVGGVVQRVWFDERGGNSVLVRHPDGRVTGYAHLRNVAVAAGDPVTADTVIGGIGDTGSGAQGTSLHFTVRAGGKQVDPATQDWRVRPRDIPLYSAGRVDKQMLYDRAVAVARAYNLTPAQTDAVIARVDVYVARSDNVRARARDDARKGVNAQIDTLGADFTDIRQIRIPPHTPPDTIAQMRDIAAANARAAEGNDARPGGDAYFDLYEMSGNPRAQDQFAATDLNPLRPRMTREEFDRLRRDQAAIRNGKEKGADRDVAVEWSRIDSHITRLAPEPADPRAKDPGYRRDRALLTDVVRYRVRAAQAKKGAPLSDDEMASIVRAQIPAIYQYDGQGDGFGDAPTDVHVPDADAAAITAAYRQSNGRAPDWATITRLYLRGLAGQ